MAFQSFKDLARRGLKRTTMSPSSILIRSEFHQNGRAQTIVRFSDDIIQKAGWTAGTDRLELFIDTSDRAIRGKKTESGGYKLGGNGNARPYIKFTAAVGMPVADAPTEVTEIVVVGGEVMFILPASIRLLLN